MGKAIGIDLGTTNSCAAVVENNQPKIIMYKGGNYTIPSMFAVDDAGNKLVGHDAKKVSQLNPASTVYASKRLIGRNYGSKTIEKVRQLFTYEIMEGEDEKVLVKVKDQVFSLEEVSANILSKIREVSQDYLHDEITSAVITVPAYFNERQRQAVRKAGQLASLNVIRILNEPTAAALAYGLGKNLNQKLAVYDLGGGTFDISIIEVKDKIFEVIATGGDTMLGGIDLDNRIMEWIISTFQKENGIDLSNNIVAVQRIKESAERAKIDLSTLEETRINIPFIARGPKGTLNVDMVLSRDQLEMLTGDLIDRTLATCERVLEKSRLSLKDLDEVLLVGGQSRMPLVQKRVTEFFKRQPCKGVHPDEAVAVGAAIMAHSLTDQSYHKVELLDVLPMAIGIAKVNGELLKLFPKFSPIPSYKSLILTNSKDNQKSIMLKIYQGDNDIAVENEILGTFIFSGIREAPRNTVKVEVLFHIDSEGILTLTAKDKDTGQQMETILKVKSSEGDDKKGNRKRSKTGKAAIKTVKGTKGGKGKAAGKSAEGKKGSGRRATKRSTKPAPAPKPDESGKAPWEKMPANPEWSKLPPPSAQNSPWHDPAFDKATRELPKGEVSKILAQAKEEMKKQEESGDAKASPDSPAASANAAPGTGSDAAAQSAKQASSASDAPSPDAADDAKAAEKAHAKAADEGGTRDAATAKDGSPESTGIQKHDETGGFLGFLKKLLRMLMFWRRP